MGAIQKSGQVEQLLAWRTHLHNALIDCEVGSCLADFRQYLDSIAVNIRAAKYADELLRSSKNTTRGIYCLWRIGYFPDCAA